jgi:hypothetical protein
MLRIIKTVNEMNNYKVVAEDMERRKLSDR